MKWRGPVLHRFVVALVDDQPEVRALGRYLLEDALATKVPGGCWWWWWLQGCDVDVYPMLLLLLLY